MLPSMENNVRTVRSYEKTPTIQVPATPDFITTFVIISLLHFLYSYIRRSTFLISTSGAPFLFLSFPSGLSDTHAFLLLLAQLCVFSSNLLFNKHSLKAIHLFTI